jgi:hypothetical protein
MASTISSWEGKRPVWNLLKIIFPSTFTSKMPPPPAIRRASTLNRFFRVVARLAALGW